MTTQTLIDTGASITVAPMRLLDLIPELRKYPILKSRYSCVQTAGKGKLNVVGFMKIPAYVGNKRVMLNVNLVDILTHGLILGLDF